MASTDKNMDQYFRERLSSHEVKPSKLAWERLDSQLSKKQEKAAFPWFRVAAIGLLLIGFGYIFLSLLQQNTDEILDTTALVVEPSLPETRVETEIPLENAMKSEIPPSTTSKSIESSKPRVKPETRQAVERQEKIQDFIAEANTTQAEETFVSVPEIELPELKLDETVAENVPVPEAEEAPAYRIIIKSNGIKDEPQKQNLIAGIENKVEKIGGLITKVEQGFADLQDAKDNLFDINAARKEKSPK